MAFRDATEALRQRVGMLEAELETERERLAEARAELGELLELRARVAELERELEKLAPPPAPVGGPSHERRPGARLRRRAIAIGCVAAAAGALLYVSGVLVSGVDDDAPPTSGTIVLAETAAPRTVQARVQGTIDASALDGACAGYVPEAPLVVLRAPHAITVVVLAASSTDTVLFVRTADGAVHCDDDSGGNGNAMLHIAVGPGDHRAWVGTRHEGERAGVVVGIAAVAPPGLDDAPVAR